MKYVFLVCCDYICDCGTTKHTHVESIYADEANATAHMKELAEKNKWDKWYVKKQKIL